MYASTSLTGCAKQEQVDVHSRSEPGGVENEEDFEKTPEEINANIDAYGTNFSFYSDEAISNYTEPAEDRVHEISRVSNAQTLLDLRPMNGSFGGDVYIRYTHNNVPHIGMFDSYSDRDTSQNSWIDIDPSSREDWRWKGFFQDTGGAIVVVIDALISENGDGASPTAFGTIWFKNFDRRVGQNEQSPSACWKIRTGPYECRASMRTRTVESDSQSYIEWYPDSGYQKLGEFSVNLSETGLNYPRSE